MSDKSYQGKLKLSPRANTLLERIQTRENGEHGAATKAEFIGLIVECVISTVATGNFSFYDEYFGRTRRRGKLLDCRARALFPEIVQSMEADQRKRQEQLREELQKEAEAPSMLDVSALEVI